MKKIRFFSGHASSRHHFKRTKWRLKFCIWQKESRPSWWFQPIWKILVKLDHFPRVRGENKKYVSNHHLADLKITQQKGGSAMTRHDRSAKDLKNRGLHWNHCMWLSSPMAEGKENHPKRKSVIQFVDFWSLLGGNFWKGHLNILKSANTRWAPTSYKWGYGAPVNIVNGRINGFHGVKKKQLFIGVSSTHL